MTSSNGTSGEQLTKTDKLRLRWIMILHYTMFVYSTYAAVFFLDPDLFHATVPTGARELQVWTISGIAASILSCLNLSAALLVPQRKGYRYLLAVGVINCALIPIGTFTGLFSIFTLRSPMVKGVFHK
jgi:hypothetical protein